MKILLLGLIFGSISYIGYKLGDSYRQKEVFYNEFNKLIIYIKNQISFFKTNILEILDNYDTKNLYINKIIRNYKNFLENNQFYELDILSKNENEDIYNFLKGIGKNDCFTQNEFLSKNLDFFNNKLEECKQLNLKHGVLYKKLGVLLGIFVCLILI